MAARPASPPRKPVVVDTDVLIALTRGSVAARDLFDSIPHGGRFVAAIVCMELLHGARDRSELRRLRRFLDSAFGGVVHISTEISRRATALVERHTLAHKLAPADALVAATALTPNAVLATGNVRHFDFIPGLPLLPFKESA